MAFNNGLDEKGGIDFEIAYNSLSYPCLDIPSEHYEDVASGSEPRSTVLAGHPYHVS